MADWVTGGQLNQAGSIRISFPRNLELDQRDHFSSKCKTCKLSEVNFPTRETEGTDADLQKEKKNADSQSRDKR